MHLMKLTAYAISLPFTLSLLPAAAADFSHMELAIAAGPSWYKASNGYTQPYTQETDLDHVNNVTKSSVYQVGLGYRIFMAQASERVFFNDILVQLNLSQSSATIKGTVWDNGNPAMAYQSFAAPFTSRRLMLDVKPSLVHLSDFSLYPIAGLGVAWNRLSYSETQINAYPGTIDAPAHTTTTVAYDLGLGLSYTITEHLQASLDYVTTHLGRMSPSSYSTTNQTLVSEAHFPVRTTSVLVGLSWKF